VPLHCILSQRNLISAFTFSQDPSVISLSLPRLPFPPVFLTKVLYACVYVCAKVKIQRHMRCVCIKWHPKEFSCVPDMENDICAVMLLWIMDIFYYRHVKTPCMQTYMTFCICHLNMHA
jgi:hypothetical protein